MLSTSGQHQPPQHFDNMNKFKIGDYVYNEDQDYYGFIVDIIDEYCYVVRMEDSNKTCLHHGDYLELIRSVEEIEKEIPPPISLELIEETPILLTPYEMRDGELGIIRKWAFDEQLYVGAIVQRYRDTLLIIGRPVEDQLVYSADTFSDRNHYKIQLLKKGDTLKIN